MPLRVIRLRQLGKPGFAGNGVHLGTHVPSAVGVVESRVSSMLVVDMVVVMVVLPSTSVLGK